MIIITLASTVSILHLYCEMISSLFISRLSVDGGWSKWSQWSVCTKTISGLQARIRECVDPEPAYGGKKCNGTRAVVRECSNMSSCHEGT